MVSAMKDKRKQYRKIVRHDLERTLATRGQNIEIDFEQSGNTIREPAADPSAQCVTTEPMPDNMGNDHPAAPLLAESAAFELEPNGANRNVQSYFRSSFLTIEPMDWSLGHPAPLFTPVDDAGSVVPYSSHISYQNTGAQSNNGMIGIGGT